MPGECSGTHGGVSLVESSTSAAAGLFCSFPRLGVWVGWVGGGWFTQVPRWRGWGQTHCWVLKDQPHALGAGIVFSRFGGVGAVWCPGGVGWASVPASSAVARMGGGGGWWGCCLRSA